MSRRQKTSFHKGVLIAIAGLVALGSFGFLLRGWKALPPSNVAAKGTAVPSGNHPSSAVAAAGAPAPSAMELARREARFASFQMHPFAISHESAHYDWTAEDGKDPGVIRQLAHNELEFERMAEESSRIFRRQLVYVRETPDMMVQQSRADGQAVQQFPLPGLDGQEVPFRVTSSDLSPSGEQGTFTGHVEGEPDSTVTFAFKGGREAFTILSPSDHTYLVGEPRESGEVLVKSIDPATYVVGVCGTQ